MEGESEIDFAREPGDGDVSGLFRLVGAGAWAAADQRFNARLAKDQDNQQKYFPDGPITRDFQKQAAMLDEPFEKSFGCPFTKFLLAIAVAWAIEDRVPSLRLSTRLYASSSVCRRGLAFAGWGGRR